MSKNSKFEGPVFILLASGIGCFLLSFFAMGLAPWTSLKNVTSRVQSGSNPYINEKGEITSIGRGRKIYIREGCWHCHSQFVRPVAGEPYRYGPASQAWESAYDVPHTFGTRRVGPDLSREAGRHSDDWHIAHLYNPRFVVPLSIMPSYPWMFENGSEGIKPKQEALDLVAYLQYLGSPYKEEIRNIVHPKLFKVSGAPLENEIRLERGALLFRENCTGCHGASGNGEGMGSAFLKPKAANLVKRYISPSEAYSILNRGVYGSAMPSFREMPEQDLWSIAQYVATLGKDTKESTLKVLKISNPQNLEEGKKIFNTRCISCHGEDGSGNTAVATALNPAPKDFTRRVFYREHLEEIVSRGIPGTAMPPASGLTPTQIDSLSLYVSHFYNEKL